MQLMTGKTCHLNYQLCRKVVLDTKSDIFRHLLLHKAAAVQALHNKNNDDNSTVFRRTALQPECSNVNKHDTAIKYQKHITNRFSESVVNFIKNNNRLFTRWLTCNYIAKIIC